MSNFSAAVALRLTAPEDTSQESFKTERMKIRSKFFALEDEGHIFFSNKGSIYGNENIDILECLVKANELTDGRRFGFPGERDKWAARRKQAAKLRSMNREFIRCLQNRIGDEWRE